MTETYNTKTVQKTLRPKVHGNAKKLKEEYTKSIEKISCHLFNSTHQYHITSKYRQTLGEHEAWLHIDFAENWCCKGLGEVQAAHFGGSHSQVTLHTTVTKAPLNVCDGNDDQSTRDLPIAMTTEAPVNISDDTSEGDYVAMKIDAVKRVTGSQQWKIFYAKVLPLI